MKLDSYFRATLDIIPIAIAILDMKGKILYVNDEFSKTTLFRGSEVIGKNVKNNLPYMCEFSDNSVWESLRMDLKWHGNAKNIKKNGKFYWENVQIHCITADLDEDTIYAVFKEDITDKVQKETQAMISKKMESIGQLAAGIAHEINSPLQFITDSFYFIESSLNDLINYINSIDESMQSINVNDNIQVVRHNLTAMRTNYDIDFIVGQLPDSFKRVSRGLERVSKIINAMKIFTHSGAHEKADTNINQNIEIAVLLTKNEWKYVSEVILELQEPMPPLYCNSDEINQVLINLIVNASHAIEEKKEIDGNNGTILIKTEINDNFCLISVQDNGIGVEKNNIDRVFDPFFTTKPPGKGTGQGLSIIHDIIVNKHMGKIFFDSERMQGTTVTIKLPIKSVS